MLPAMFAGRKVVVAVLALAIAGGTGYYLYAAKQKREQQRRVAELLADTTALLRNALSAPPAPEVLGRIEGNLKAAMGPGDRALAAAAEDYIHGAREIVRHRGNAERLTREAAMSRRALSMHMGAASGRDTYWIRVASDLKKRVERDHFELDTSLKAISSLLFTLPESRQRLEPLVPASLLLEESERRAARERVEQNAKRAHDELEKVRRLALPR